MNLIDTSGEDYWKFNYNPSIDPDGIIIALSVENLNTNIINELLGNFYLKK